MEMTVVSFAFWCCLVLVVLNSKPRTVRQELYHWVTPPAWVPFHRGQKTGNSLSILSEFSFKETYLGYSGSARGKSTCYANPVTLDGEREPTPESSPLTSMTVSTWIRKRYFGSVTFCSICSICIVYKFRQNTSFLCFDFCKEKCLMPQFSKHIPSESFTFIIVILVTNT